MAQMKEQGNIDICTDITGYKYGQQFSDDKLLLLLMLSIGDSSASQD